MLRAGSVLGFVDARRGACARERASRRRVLAVRRHQRWKREDAVAMDATTTEAVAMVRRLREYVHGPAGEGDDPCLLHVASEDLGALALRPYYQRAYRALNDAGYYRLAWGGHRPERLSAIDRAIATLEASDA